MSQFTGFGAEALSFYEELERDNTRQWWLAHKSTYDAAVRAPMAALVAALEPHFGPAHVFRPNRDVRFAADKAPYKTHQGAYCATEAKSYYYVHLDADGLLVGAGGYHFAPDQLARFRGAVDSDLAGPELESILAALEAQGFEAGGELLKSRPRGIPADHPRLDLVRHKSITVRRGFGAPDWMFTPAAVAHVRGEWEALGIFTAWLDQHVGPTEVEDRHARR